VLVAVQVLDYGLLTHVLALDYRDLVLTRVLPLDHGAVKDHH
jgi:hypothetical protein